MGKILQALYEGNLLAEPVTEKRSQEYQKACDFTFDLLEELSQKLNEEQKQLLDKFVNALSDEKQYCIADRFIRGYCLGALMMLEIMEKRGELIIGKEST